MSFYAPIYAVDGYKDIKFKMTPEQVAEILFNKGTKVGKRMVKERLTLVCGDCYSIMGKMRRIEVDFVNNKITLILLSFTDETVVVGNKITASELKPLRRALRKKYGFYGKAKHSPWKSPLENYKVKFLAHSEFFGKKGQIVVMYGTNYDRQNINMLFYYPVEEANRILKNHQILKASADDI